MLTNTELADRIESVGMESCEYLREDVVAALRVAAALQPELDATKEALGGLAISGVTSGANPLPNGGMSPPLWHMHCQICGVRWSKQQWAQPRDHPNGNCILADLPF